LAFQKGIARTSWQAARRLRRQDAKQRAPSRHPGERSLQDPNREVALVQIAHSEGEERTICSEIGAKQDRPRLDARYPQDVLDEARRNVQHRNRVAHERQRRWQPLESLGIARNREVARPAPRSGSQLRQVHGQPLLQLTRPTRGDQGRPRRAAADVDQQTWAIGLRAGTGKRRGGSPRSACGTDGGHENDPSVHRSAGLA
jgi:hypothetical protein